MDQIFSLKFKSEVRDSVGENRRKYEIVIWRVGK